MIVLRKPARYGVIYADPPWHYRTWSAKGRDRCPDAPTADGVRHYQTLPFETLRALPVAPLAKDDSVLLLWAPDAQLEHALELGRAWGFTYKTVGFHWVKLTKTGKRWHVGGGHWTRANPEQCLLFTRGRPRRLDKGVPKLIEAPVREHSRKPDEAYDRIERLLPGPYLELFARSRWPGWAVWGDQLDRFAA